MALFAVPMLVDCGGRATCDDLCDNVLDKCSSDFGTYGEYEDVARNNCLEECTQRSNSVPEKCALEKDDVLSCLADADSLDCADAQQSASCAAENAALNSCVFGSSNSGGGGGGGGAGDGGSTASAPKGQSCDSDNDCVGGLVCSWLSDTCIVPAALGMDCGRDNECESELCSWVDDTCIVPAESGAPCKRDTECISMSCPDDVCL